MSTHADERAIRDFNREAMEALNRGDARGFAAFYAPDADFVDSFGHVSTGRPNIESAIQGLLSGPYKGAKFNSQVDTIRFVARSIAIVDITTEVTMMQAPSRKLHGVVVAVSENG